MKTYPHGCDSDYEQELISEAQRIAHLAGECRRYCPLCQDELAQDARKINVCNEKEEQ